jgi:hypothetical protein
MHGCSLQSMSEYLTIQDVLKIMRKHVHDDKERAAWRMFLTNDEGRVLNLK